jgi:hypothetical protein
LSDGPGSLRSGCFVLAIIIYKRKKSERNKCKDYALYTSHHDYVMRIIECIAFFVFSSPSIMLIIKQDLLYVDRKHKWTNEFKVVNCIK